MSKLLYDEKPLVVNPELACQIGLNEAIILQQIHYWVGINTKAKKNLQEGFYWTYNTYKEWRGQFPFWSERTIRRTIGYLEKKGLIVTANFNKLPQDHTKWYRLDYDALVSVASPSGQSGHTKRTTWPKQEDNLAKALPETTTEITTENIDIDMDTAQVFKSYEDNIGMLTPIISELVKDDLKTFPTDWILDAIEVAVKANARKYSYVQAVLSRWATDGREAKASELSKTERSFSTQAEQEQVYSKDISLNKEAINELLNKRELSSGDIRFLDSFHIHNQSLYTILRAVRGEAEALPQNKKRWIESLEKLGVLLKESDAVNG